ncbi:MAG: DUF349 domain-containing protein [Flavobacteriaceae bacterium]|nr:DUF349 domain-containing protein [Flavobacteriaceae bacterium]
MNEFNEMNATESENLGTTEVAQPENLPMTESLHTEETVENTTNTDETIVSKADVVTDANEEVAEPAAEVPKKRKSPTKKVKEMEAIPEEQILDQVQNDKNGDVSVEIVADIDTPIESTLIETVAQVTAQTEPFDNPEIVGQGDIEQEPPAEVEEEEETEILIEETLPVLIPDEMDAGHESSGIENPVETPVEELTAENAEAFMDEHDHHTESTAEISTADLQGLDKAAILLMASDAAKSDVLSESSQTFRRVRQMLETIWNSEMQAARAQFVEAGGKPEEYKHEDPSRDEYYGYYKLFTAKRDTHKQKQEEEKLKNLKRKKEILDRIKHLAENDETDGSLTEIRTLQSEWNTIKAVPNEEREALWHNYQHYLNTFYDNHHINNELKDLDRKKNLQLKMELCTKMEALQHEKSLRKTLIEHKKLWEEWKNTGPVPNEAREPLWLTFKEAADVVFNAKMEELKVLDGERQGNLDAKVLLCERAEEFGNYSTTIPKEWVNKISEVNALFEEWKKTGPVSLKYHESIWERFKAAVDKFYTNKNDYFKGLEKQRAVNLRMKKDLVEKAEALQNSEDWGNTSKELRHLQEEWKKVGNVMDKHAETLWTRFRTACDKFFEAKNEKFAGQQQDQAKNLESKKEILVRINELATAEDNTDLSNKIKALQDEWNSYGFVPFKQKDQIGKQYKDALDAIYNRIRKDFASNSQSRNRNHYEVIARQPEGKNMLVSEERRTGELIRMLKADIDTWQNNIGFFANSKNANASAYIKQVNENIEDAKKKLAKLQDQVRTLRDVSTGKNPEKKVEESKPEVGANQELGEKEGN